MPIRHNINTAIIVILILLLAILAYQKFTQPESESRFLTETTSVAQQIEEGKEAGESMWLLFGSDTCPYCVDMKKIYDRIKPEYQGKVRFITIDVNAGENAQLAQDYGITYIPATFIINSQGKISYQEVGLLKEEKLRAELDKVVE